MKTISECSWDGAVRRQKASFLVEKVPRVRTNRTGAKLEAAREGSASETKKFIFGGRNTGGT